MDLEGIVSKRTGSRYVSGRTRAWLKAKNPNFERRGNGRGGRLCLEAEKAGRQISGHVWWFWAIRPVHYRLTLFETALPFSGGYVPKPGP